MKRSGRVILFILAILIGLGVGLVYGWLVLPPTPDQAGLQDLRMDYKTDIVLMAAELYNTENDLQAAQNRLSQIEQNSVIDLVNQAVIYARDIGYLVEDVQLMANLATALQSQ